MDKDLISASGERAALGGYLPQFDEFAWFVYVNLINKKLEWIKVADSNAEKLDDIQYATYSEIHAYQVKWTIADANISYKNFTDLLPSIVSSWKILKAANLNKKVIPHLITNKSLSSNDSIKDDEIKIGSFHSFIGDVWRKLKSRHKIDAKWNGIIEKLKESLGLNDSEFNEFIACFDFQPDYKKKNFTVARSTKYSKDEEDLQNLSRFIIEKVASPDRLVEFTRQQIIEELGWTDRFKTIFNHELVIDRQRYQPISSTIELINSKIQEYNAGYIFLIGGPGSGKSTLLNQWSKTLKERVVKYYAFDFTNPSSHLNYYERGNATNLLFDLVFQLKEAGIYKRNILPYRDIVFLKEVFSEQIKELAKEYLETKRKNLIIIDGLDHVPREYKSVVNSFLRELPLPSSLPDGVLIVLGSQSYDLVDIPQEIKTEFLNRNRSVKIDPLSKGNVYNYIDSVELGSKICNEQKLKIFEKSQGHPLYLSYLVGKIAEMESIDDLIEALPVINGDIDNYYKKIWGPINHDTNLIQFLGLISRINGLINIRFIQEWQVDKNTLKSFSEKARVLFNEQNQMLSFFHNSFKQFLISQTSFDYLTNDFDLNAHRDYHKRLAAYYRQSNIEKVWKQNYHLFEAGEYSEFISSATPDSFTSQLLNFRPTEDIKKDIKLGIEIGRQTKDLKILVRYLFCSAEIERRLFNIEPASLIEELLELKQFENAVGYIRTGNTLHCNEAYVLKAARLLLQYGQKSEAEYLYNLAYPEIIKESQINIQDGHKYEEITNTLEEWIGTASYFEPVNQILSITDTIEFTQEAKNNRFDENEVDLNLRLIKVLGYSLINQSKWDDFDFVLARISSKSLKGGRCRFHLIEYAIEECVENRDIERANTYLTLLRKYFTKDKATSTGKIYVADLIYKVTQDASEVLSWIEDLEQPSDERFRNDLRYSNSIDAFLPLVKLNKLLNICEKGVPITTAVPAAIIGSDEEILVEFERMLLLVTQILSEGLMEIPIENILTRISPITNFYYREISHRNLYKYKLNKCKGAYFEYLIFAVSKTGVENIIKAGNHLFCEFDRMPKYWDGDTQRKIVLSLLNCGFSKELCNNRLARIEGFMLDDRDIDGRITECISHAKAYLILNDNETGEKWLKQAIQESIGVGYRKDYQFNAWIDWLRKINQSNPSNADQRIKWFLSHLDHIKETTEGRAFWEASEQLLGATLEYNLHDGLEQLKWQIEHNLIEFTEAMALFIKYYMKRAKNRCQFDKAVDLYINIYLLLEESGETTVLSEVLNVGYKLCNRDFFEDQLIEIVDSINIKAFESNRYYLLTEIDTFIRSKGHEASEFYPTFSIPKNNKAENYSSSSKTLVLKGKNNNLKESEVFQRINNFDDFMNLLLSEDKANSYFKWSNVIDKIAPLISLEQLKELENIPNIASKGIEFYAKLSELAYDKGDPSMAETLAQKSIGLSSESGWINHFDGGTRIIAFNALKKINPSLAVNRAFEVFAQDIIATDYPSSYIHNLEDITLLLRGENSREEIWKELYDYLKRLMANSRRQLDLPVFDSFDYTIEKVFNDYLFYLLTTPVAMIKEAATIILAKHLDQGDKSISECLLNRGLDDYSISDILTALCKLNSLEIKGYLPLINDLALLSDFELRNNAVQILKSLNEIVPLPQFRALSGIYSLHIPEIEIPDFGKDTDHDLLDIDIHNPKELIRPFGYLIKYLSHISDIEESNLLAIAHAKMKKEGDETEWTKAYEDRIRYNLEEIGLKYSFQRPRVIAAHRAIMHIATELIDSNKVTHNEIEKILISKDWDVPFFPSLMKPFFIQTVKGSEFGGVAKDWVNRIEESHQLKKSKLLDYSNGFSVIAEHSWVKNLDWGNPTEEYTSQIAVNAEIDESKEYIFGSAFHKLSKDYHNLSSGGRFIIICRNHQFNQFDLKSQWIAINPSLARYLGWIPEYNKLFAWQNSNGQLMAESIYWSNGNFNITPRKDGDVGEGWFVIASDLALDAIHMVEKDLFFQQKLLRYKYEDDISQEKQVLSVSKI